MEQLIVERPFTRGIKAASSDLEVKLGWYRWLTFQNESPHVLMNMMPILFLPYQQEVTKHLREKFYEDAIAVTRKNTVEFLNAWIRGMFSFDPEEDGIDHKVQNLLEQLSDNGNDLCLKGYLTHFKESALRKKSVWELERKKCWK